MPSREEMIALLCSLPLELSRSDGISMLRAIDESGYRGNESAIGESDIRQYLLKHRHLIQEWSSYSESKRAGSGWHFDPDLKQVGLFLAGRRDQIQTFDDGASACACFIKKEVDSVLDIAV